MREAAILQIVSLRLTVGLIGESDNAGWWSSRFMSPTSTAFLSPVFGPHVFQARYHGVLEAARRIHDERIGIGRVFHPFRLQEAVEQRIFDAVQTVGPRLAHCISSPDAAKTALLALAGKPVAVREGPALVGTSEMLDGTGWVAAAAALYSAAFAAGVQCLPYFTGAR